MGYHLQDIWRPYNWFPLGLSHLSLLDLLMVDSRCIASSSFSHLRLQIQRHTESYPPKARNQEMNPTIVGFRTSKYDMIFTTITIYCLILSWSEFAPPCVNQFYMMNCNSSQLFVPPRTAKTSDYKEVLC